MVIPVMQCVDFLLGMLPALAWIVTWGTLTGILSMLVYWRLSPQQRLAEVTRQAMVARQELQSFDGEEIRVYGRLTLRALACSLTQIRLVLLPTALAMVPIISIAISVDYSYDFPHRPLWNRELDWWNTWATAFWAPLGIAALAMKIGFRIK